MDDAPETSLDRFLKSRGAQLLGYSSMKAGVLIQSVIGGGMLALGLGFLAAPLMGADPSVQWASMGPIMAGAVNLVIGQVLRRKLVQGVPAPIALTPEAKALLQALYRDSVGSATDWIWNGNSMIHVSEGQSRIGRRARRRQRLASALSGDNPDAVPADVAPHVEELLDRAAFEFNRIAGCLATGQPSNATIAKLAPQVSAATDEAMADALHHAALLTKYPESGEASRTRLETHIAAMGEVADRIEEIVAKVPALSESIGRRSRIDDVIEELRLDQMARKELQKDPPREESVQDLA